jgi:hypothetical protein
MLNEDAIRDILTSSDTPKQLAERYRCARSTIALVIYGDAHADVLPEIPRRPPDRSTPRSNRYRAPLGEDAVRDILTSAEPHNILALRYNRNRSTIIAIRRGTSHATVLPGIPRQILTCTCKDCRHWVHGPEPRCDLGFPDPLEEGVKFARDCSTFAPERCR